MQKSKQVWPLVIEDMKERNEMGEEKYNRYLQTDCPDDMLQHAYEEALDLAVYLKTQIEKQKPTKIVKVPNKVYPKIPFTKFGKTKLIPRRIFVNRRESDEETYTNILWIERSEEWYALRDEPTLVVIRDEFISAEDYKE